MGTERLTWFGGKEGVRWNGDARLHLLAPDGATFCKIHAGLRPAVARELEKEQTPWCETCLERGQAS